MISPALKGVFRSLRMYHGAHVNRSRMDSLYARFISPGDLAFDIGAHAGDRISSFRRLGARVTAVEPQPRFVRALRLIHGRDGDVTIVEAACASRPAPVEFFVNTANPTVSTASRAFIAATEGRPGWQDQSWDRNISVNTLTLDQLIGRYGCPAFIKVDVEGFEDDVLHGLSEPIPALSFEFTTVAREVAYRALSQLEELGAYRFNFSAGESHVLEFQETQTGAAMRVYLEHLPHAANSGDVYATLQSAG